jgi:LemA protein
MALDNNSRIPEDITDEVLQVASELYQKTQDTYAVSDLKAAGQEVNIPPELIEQAIEQVRERQRVQALQAEKQRENRRKLGYIGAGIGAIALLWGILTYNSLSSASRRVESAWAQVENQFQRRADLIPQLITITQAQAKQEQDIIKQLTGARQGYLAANTTEEKVTASRDIDIAIQNFNRYAATTDLGSSKAFINLQYEIAGTENRIATERKRYNDAVGNYNEEVGIFPNSIVAVLTGLQPKEFFKATNQEIPKY